jgi:hypothetical protein
LPGTLLSVDDLAERFALAERQGLIALIRDRPELPVAELLDLLEVGRAGRLLGTLTIGECQSGVADPEFVETIDKATLRAVYDARILDVLAEADEPLSPTEVCDRVGGTARQARTALQRLAAANKVRRTWKARGQGYELQ